MKWHATHSILSDIFTSLPITTCTSPFSLDFFFNLNRIVSSVFIDLVELSNKHVGGSGLYRVVFIQKLQACLNLNEVDWHSICHVCTTHEYMYIFNTIQYKYVN